MSTLIGHYLDRDVLFVRTNLEDFENILDMLVGAVVFLDVTGLMLSEIEANRIKSQMLRVSPLTIVIRGDRGDALLDTFLLYLGKYPRPEFIMVYSSTYEDEFEAIEAFILATIPPTERWDSWKQYCIVAMGDSVVTNALMSSCLKFVTNR